jgi:hypothetical protein
MSAWELVFLGIMAAALVAMAIAQMLLAREVARVARQATETARDVRRDLQPILDKLNRITDDGAKVTALAVTQMERLDTAVASTLARVEEVVTVVQDAVVQPIRQGLAILAGIKAALSIFGKGRGRDEDDSMFIG